MPWTLKIFWKHPKRTYLCPNSLEESRWENNKITMFPGVFFGVSLGVLHFWLSACSSWAWLSAPRSLKAWRSGIGDLPGIPSDIRSTKGKTMDKLGLFLMLLGGDLTCFNHLMKKVWTSSVGMMKFPCIMENKKCSKPPTSILYGYDMLYFETLVPRII